MAKKKTRRKTTRRSRGKNLAPSQKRRGLSGKEVALDLESGEIAPLVEEVAAAGGTAVGAYREPLAGRPVLIATLPLSAVRPTPFQRDLSPTHVKRLAQKIEESGSFLDPLTVVRSVDGLFWTPNGRHRLAAAKLLGLQQITALISPDEDLSFRILALNTEKAHNLKDKSLEVIRMARELAARHPRVRESAFSAEFEAAEHLTLGIVYEHDKRFAGGAYSPFLKKVDRFSDKTLRKSLEEREDRAARLLEIEAQVKKIIDKLKKRGFRSPYLRSYVVARLNPVRFHRAKKGDTKPPMTLAAALTRMASAAKKFDVTTVKPSELALVAAVASDDA